MDLGRATDQDLEVLVMSCSDSSTPPNEPATPVHGEHDAVEVRPPANPPVFDPAAATALLLLIQRVARSRPDHATLEVGGPIDPDSEAHDLIMSVFGGMSKGERNRIKIRVRAAMAAQARIEGRYLGGRDD